MIDDEFFLYTILANLIKVGGFDMARRFWFNNSLNWFVPNQKEFYWYAFSWEIGDRVEENKRLVPVKWMTLRVPPRNKRIYGRF